MAKRVDLIDELVAMANKMPLEHSSPPQTLAVSLGVSDSNVPNTFTTSTPNQTQSLTSEQLISQNVAGMHGSIGLLNSSQAMLTHPQYSTIYQQPTTSTRLATNPNLSSMQAPSVLPQVAYNSLPQPGLQHISSQQPFQATSYPVSGAETSHIPWSNQTQPASLGSLPQVNQLTVQAPGVLPQMISGQPASIESLSQANLSNEQAPVGLSQVGGGLQLQNSLLGFSQIQPVHGSYPASGAQAITTHTQQSSQTQPVSVGSLTQANQLNIQAPGQHHQCSPSSQVNMLQTQHNIPSLSQPQGSNVPSFQQILSQQQMLNVFGQQGAVPSQFSPQSSVVQLLPQTQRDQGLMSGSNISGDLLIQLFRNFSAQLGVPLPLTSIGYDCMLTYAHYLKGKYQYWTELPDPRWPPLRGDKMTNLALIERKKYGDALSKFDKKVLKSESIKYDYIHGKIDSILARKKEIQFVDVFEYDEDSEGRPLRVLMDGAPGVGKTTLSRKACIDWAGGEFLHKYCLVVYVPLRDARSRDAKEITDLFPADDPDLKEKVVKHVIKAAGKGVLLIFDGFDELTDKQRRHNSLFLDIIKGNKLSQCSVLVTSRPYASGSLQHVRSVVRHVEVLGFTTKQIGECIKQNIEDSEKATELITKLKERADIASLCYIPLNCAIMIFVYQKHDYELPHTLTDLFKKFIFDTLKRHTFSVLSDDYLDNLLSESNLQTLPEPLKSQLHSLGKLAYNSLLEDKLVFTYGELASVFPECNQASDIQSRCLDLVTVMVTYSTNGEEMHYQFLHLSIQEFLAAVYICNSFSDKEIRSFFQEKWRINRFHLVLLFLAGLTKLELPLQEKIIGNKMLDLTSIGTSKDLTSKKEFHYCAHIIFESQNTALYKILLSKLKDQTVFSLSSFILTQFDCMVIAHFLCSTNHFWKKLCLEACLLDSRSLKAFREVCALYDTSQTSFEEVSLSYNRPDLVTNLSIFPTEWIRESKLFRLHSTQNIDDSSNTLICATNLAHIPVVDIFAQLHDGKQALCKFSPKSSKLMVHFVKIGDLVKLRENLKEVRDISISGIPLSANVVLQVIAMHELSSLSLTGNAISFREAVDLLKAIKSNMSLTKLNLQGNDFGHLREEENETLGLAFQTMLENNKKLTTLNLQNTAINDTVAQCVSTGLLFNVSLNKLNLDDNDLSIDAAVALISSLKSNVRLTNLQLLNCFLFQNKTGFWHVVSSDNCDLCQQQKFIQAFNESSIAQSLNFKHIILEMEDLLRNDTDFSSSFAIENIVKTCTTLKTLKLSTNEEDKNSDIAKLDESEVSAERVSKIMLQLNLNSLSEVKIYGIHLCRRKSSSVWYSKSNQVPVKFLNALNMCDGKLTILLNHLDLRNHNLTCDELISICRSVKHITTLQELDLSHNSEIMASEENSSSLSLTNAISRMLQSHPALTTLNLSYGSVNESVARGIVAGVKLSKTLKTLNLIGNKLSVSTYANILSAIQFSTLNELQIDNATLLCNSPGIWQLIVSTKQLIPFLDVLQQSTIKVQLNDESLDLSNAAIDSSQVIVICRSICNLKELDLSKNQKIKEESDTVSTAVTTMILSSTTLKILKLTSGSINDKIAKSISVGLKSSESLVELDVVSNQLSDTVITDLILAAFSNKSTVRRLKTPNIVLARSSHKKPWKIINLNSLCEKDVFLVLHALSMQNTSTLSLKKIDFSKASLNDCEIQSVCEAVNHIPDVEELDLFSCAKDIESEETSGKIGDHGQSAMYSLKQLYFNTTTVSEETIAYLLSSANSKESLKHLCIGNVKLSRTVNQCFWEFNEKYLPKEFHIFFSPILSNTTMRILLKQLDLSEHCEVTQEVMITVLKCVQNNMSINTLDLSNNPHLTKCDCNAIGLAFQSMLANNESLEILKVQCSANDTVANKIADGLAKSVSLKELHIEKNQLGEFTISRLLSSANSSQSLVYLCMSIVSMCRKVNGQWEFENVNLSKDFYLAFCPILCQSTMRLFLQVLDVSYTNITHQLVIAVLKCIQSNMDVTTVDLSNNPHLNEEDCEEIATAFENMLQVNKSLKILKLQSSVNNIVINRIASVLNRNASLEELYIDKKGLSELAIANLLSSASANQTLLYLSLKDVNLCRKNVSTHLWEFDDPTMESQLSFYSILCQSTMRLFLQELDLSCTNIMLDVVLAVLKCVQSSMDITTLDLSGIDCSTKDVCIQTFRSMLEMNTTLVTLKVCNGAVNDILAQEIAAGLLKNRHLQELYLECNELLTYNGAADILASLLSSSNQLSKVYLWNIEMFTYPDHSGWCVYFKQHGRIENFFQSVNLIELNNISTIFSIERDVSSHKVLLLLQLLCSNTSLADVTFKQCNFLPITLDLANNDMASTVGHDCEREYQCAAKKLLEENSVLTKITFDSSRVSEKFLSGLASGLNANTTLSSLHFSHCYISDASLKNLIDNLAQNETLKTLGINLHYSQRSLNCLCKLMDKSHANLEYIIVDPMPKLMGFDAIACQINKELVKCTKIACLTICVGLSEAKMIFDLLKENYTTLKTLVLEVVDNSCNDRSKLKTAAQKMIERNKTLQELQICCYCRCSITPSSKYQRVLPYSGIQRTRTCDCKCNSLLPNIFQGMCSNTCLRKILTKCCCDKLNYLTDKNLHDSLTLMLEKNKTLHGLDVSSVCFAYRQEYRYFETDLDPEATLTHKEGRVYYHLAIALLTNSTLQELQLSVNVKNLLENQIERVKRTKNIDTTNWKLKLVGA